MKLCDIDTFGITVRYCELMSFCILNYSGCRWPVVGFALGVHDKLNDKPIVKLALCFARKNCRKLKAKDSVQRNENVAQRRSSVES